MGDGVERCEEWEMVWKVRKSGIWWKVMLSYNWFCKFGKLYTGVI